MGAFTSLPVSTARTDLQTPDGFSNRRIEQVPGCCNSVPITPGFFGLDPASVQIVRVRRGFTSSEVFDTFTLHIIQAYIASKGIPIGNHYHFTNGQALMLFKQKSCEDIPRLIKAIDNRRQLCEGNEEFIDAKIGEHLNEKLGILAETSLCQQMLKQAIPKLRKKCLDARAKVMPCTICVVDLIPDQTNEIRDHLEWLAANARSQSIFLVLRESTAFICRGLRADVTMECQGNPEAFVSPLITSEE